MLELVVMLGVCVFTSAQNFETGDNSTVTGCSSARSGGIKKVSTGKRICPLRGDVDKTWGAERFVGTLQDINFTMCVEISLFATKELALLKIFHFAAANFLCISTMAEEDYNSFLY
uniref:Secreted protein n=1 Tax=Parascaris equorum TaxID=6256 RepID=A0A914R720_PAREQ